MRNIPGRAKGLACGPLKETSQTGDWQLETGNWQDWGQADLLGTMNTPLRALRGARWRIRTYGRECWQQIGEIISKNVGEQSGENSSESTC